MSTKGWDKCLQTNKHIKHAIVTQQLKPSEFELESNDDVLAGANPLLYSDSSGSYGTVHLIGSTDEEVGVPETALIMEQP
jgi:hypothetical protein